ncbi:MAG: ankyrin repeat domain-containing protein [Armatimonadetes bacterium]|nr:ankyrin repeat domain-containing protein [Armatimonadota bacterium]
MRAVRDLLQAVRCADTRRAEELLRVHPNLIGTEGLLHLAVAAPRSLGAICAASASALMANRRAMVKLLLAHGADVNATDIHGETPLFRAVSQGHDEMVELLLERGANPNVPSRSGETPLHRAAQKRRLALLPILLSQGAVMEVKDHRGLTPLQVAHDDDTETVTDIFSRYEAAQRLIDSFAADASGSRDLYSSEMRSAVRFLPTLVTTGAFAL